MYEEIKKQFEEVRRDLIDPEITKDISNLKEVSKKHANLKNLVEDILELEKLDQAIKDNQEVLKNEKDDELKEMSREELPSLEKKFSNLEEKIEEEVHPQDPNDKKNIIMEVRAGTGGDESALFAAEIFRMYSRFAEKRGWKVDILDANRIGIGGFKEVIFSIAGRDVYKYLKYEGGTHRVQRVPETEKQGRVHTSAVTVAVMPEAEEVDLEIKNEDIRIDVYSASGPGGQSVNTSNSAVRITHLPTGIMAQCQDEKSQYQNKDKAMQLLRSRLFNKIEEERLGEEAESRKKQVGTGDRSEKIRTYNFPQDRITDHRIKKSWSNMYTILDGDLDDIINNLKEAFKK